MSSQTDYNTLYSDQRDTWVSQRKIRLSGTLPSLFLVTEKLETLWEPIPDDLGQVDVLVVIIGVYGELLVQAEKMHPEARRESEQRRLRVPLDGLEHNLHALRRESSNERACGIDMN